MWPQQYQQLLATEHIQRWIRIMGRSCGEETPVSLFHVKQQLMGNLQGEVERQGNYT